jgi:hypothetical protein
VSQLTLFDMEPAAPPDPGKPLGRDARRTVRRARGLASGVHPVGLCFGFLLRLHEDAPPPDDRTAAGPRCGNCVHADGNEFGYLKCMRGRQDGQRAPYDTHGTASDLRAWWPACIHWQSPFPAGDTP